MAILSLPGPEGNRGVAVSQRCIMSCASARDTKENTRMVLAGDDSDMIGGNKQVDTRSPSFVRDRNGPAKRKAYL
jgi:hypothetical protein